MNLTLHMWKDLVGLVRIRLAAAGFTADPSMSDDDVLLGWINARHRRIEIHPRGVVRTKEFTCPAECNSGLNALSTAIAQGDDLSPYQSRSIKKAWYDDDLLNDWGIHHFHLGVGLEPDGFICRTGPLLFGIVTNQIVGMIQVMSHNSFSEQTLLEILQRNWPEFLKHSQLHGMLGLEASLSDKEIKELRKAGITPIVGVTGAGIFAAPGGGVSTDGTSQRVVRTLIDIRKQVNALEKGILMAAWRIAERAKVLGIDLVEPVPVTLSFDGSTMFVFEERTQFRIPVPQLEHVLAW